MYTYCILLHRPGPQSKLVQNVCFNLLGYQHKLNSAVLIVTYTVYKYKQVDLTISKNQVLQILCLV